MTRRIEIRDEDVEAVRGLLLRSIATDQAAISKYNLLGMAYADRPSGQDASAQLAQARGKKELAESLLRQLDEEPSGG